MKRNPWYEGPIEVRRHSVHNRDGWLLDVRRYADPRTLDRARRPLLIVPGYCMNTTPLTYHPSGRSLIRFLTEAGLEVWTANLRGQGDSISIGGTRDVGFEALALADLPAAIESVLFETESTAERVDVLGCSLGGTFIYAYLAHHPSHRIGSIVGMGAPLRWASLHPLLKVAFSSPRLARMVRVRGTRAAARRLLPVAARVPAVLSIYMNAAHVDLTDVDRLVETVKDPIPRLNEEIARWLAGADLVVRGVDVTAAMRRVDRPVLSIYANRDGIVPPRAAAAIQEVMGPERADVLKVGDEHTWYAHADLFIGRTAEERVFTPLFRWLTDPQRG